jgi:hypothetical protein
MDGVPTVSASGSPSSYAATTIMLRSALTILEEGGPHIMEG